MATQPPNGSKPDELKLTLEERVRKLRLPSNGVPKSEKNGETRRLIGKLVAGMEKLKSKVHRYKDLLLIDTKTGLLNEDSFEIEAIKVLKRRKRKLNLAEEDFKPAWMIIFDIDNFKQFNSDYSHVGGDAVLKLVADALNEEALPGDTVARLHGDEFAMLMYDATREKAVDMVKNVWQTVKEKSIICTNKDGDEEIVHVTVSGGVAEMTRDIADYKSLKDNASAEMLAAKAARKNDGRLTESAAHIFDGQKNDNGPSIPSPMGPLNVPSQLAAIPADSFLPPQDQGHMAAPAGGNLDTSNSSFVSRLETEKGPFVLPGATAGKK